MTVARRRDSPQFQTSYQQVARLRGRPVALGGSLKHRSGRWKTLVNARRANKVVPVRTKCRYIFYTRYRQHLQPAIELSFALFPPPPFTPRSFCRAVLTSWSISLLSLPSPPLLSLSLSRGVCFANSWYVACGRSFSWHFKVPHTTEFLLRRQNIEHFRCRTLARKMFSKHSRDKGNENFCICKEQYWLDTSNWFYFEDYCVSYNIVLCVFLQLNYLSVRSERCEMLRIVSNNPAEFSVTLNLILNIRFYKKKYIYIIWL